MPPFALVVLLSGLQFGIVPLPPKPDWAGRVDGVFRRSAVAPPVRDPLLDEAARAALELPPEADVRAALRDAGVYDGVVIPLLVLAPDAVASALLHHLERHVVPQRVTHYGLAVGGLAVGNGRLVAVFVRRTIELEPLQRPDANARFVKLAGRLVGPYRRARVVVARPDGGIETIAVQSAPSGGPRDHRIEAYIPMVGGDGRYLVELLADGPSGREVLALLPVTVGDLPSLPTLKLAAPPREAQSARALAERLVGLINEERRRRGLRLLKWDRRLHGSATDHAHAMAKRGMPVHVLPGGRGPLDRVAAAGVIAAVFYENVALARTVEQAHAELWDSPSHREAMLDERLTRIGVAVVPASSGGVPVLYVCEHLAAIGRF